MADPQLKQAFRTQNTLLSCIIKAAQSSNTAGLATESTLQSILSAVDSARDFEVRLVVDSDAPPVTWLEVRNWDEGSGALGTPLYYLPGSIVAGTPVGSLSYINPQTLLSSILAELLTLNTTDFSTETTLVSLLTELQAKADLTETQPVSLASIPLPTGAATQTTLAALLTELQLKADLTEVQPISAAALPLPTGAATQTTLAALLTELQAKADLVETQPVSLTSSTRTPGLIRATNAVGSPIAAGARSILVFNAGNADGDILGGTNNIKPGESLPFNAGGEGDILPAFAFDGTGTELVIITMV